MQPFSRVDLLHVLPAACVTLVGGCVALQRRNYSVAPACSESSAKLEPKPESVSEVEPQLELASNVGSDVSGHWRKSGSARLDGDRKHRHSEALAQPAASETTRSMPVRHSECNSKAAVSAVVSAPDPAHATRLRLEGEQRFRAIVQYDGTDFEGWQTQPNGRTIQDELEKRLGSVLLGRGKRLAVAGSGRTDAGVHAKAQVFHFECPRDHWAFTQEQSGHVKSQEELTADRLLQKIILLARSHERPAIVGPGLSMSIRVMSVEPVSHTFHARHSCTAKRYIYTLRDGGLPSPFEHRWCWAPSDTKMLDVGAMQRAAACLVGKHDFTSFGKVLPGDPRDPVKHMRSLVVERMPLLERGDASDSAGGIVTITATCNRFLWNMMRRIVGTLVQVGLGKMSETAVGELLAAKSQPTSRLAVYTAPARGLCLDHVFYEQEREVEGSRFTPK